MTTWGVRAITRTLLPILLALTAMEIGSGLVLESFEGTLFRYPSLLILVPVMIGTAGNLGSILAARLSTAFHLGTLALRPDDEVILGNGTATLLLAISVFPAVGGGGWLLATLAGGAALPLGVVVAIALASGVILALLAIGVTLAATYGAYRFELDPDDVAIPIVTNVCDVLGVVVLLVVTRAIL